MNEPQRQFGARVADARGVAIDQGLRQYMLGVYNYMALGVAGTGFISMLVASNEALVRQISGLWLVGFIGIIGIGLLAPRIILNGSKVTAHALFWIYAALWGVMIAPMLYAFQQQGASIDIYRAFFMAASVFGALSLWGYTTKKDLTGWASILGIGLIGAIVMMLLNAFVFKSSMMSLFLSSGVVVLIAAVTAYETQIIKSMYREGHSSNERTAIFGAFALYGSFVTLFVHILNILGIMRGD